MERGTNYGFDRTSESSVAKSVTDDMTINIAWLSHVLRGYFLEDMDSRGARTMTTRLTNSLLRIFSTKGDDSQRENITKHNSSRLIKDHIELNANSIKTILSWSDSLKKDTYHGIGNESLKLIQQSLEKIIEEIIEKQKDFNKEGYKYGRFSE